MGSQRGKRLVRSPKIYVRDSGIVHALLGLGDKEDVLAHPVVGGSWEGFVIENLLAVAPTEVTASFYRTSAGAEIDLVLTWHDRRRLVVEIKRSLTPRLSRGFHSGWSDLRPEREFVVWPGDGRHRLADAVEAISLPELCARLRSA